MNKQIECTDENSQIIADMFRDEIARAMQKKKGPSAQSLLNELQLESDK
jgi:hypothetical protein